MKHTTFLFLTVLFNLNLVYAQSDYVTGKTYTIESNVLEETRTIHVYVPEGYEKSEKEYPTLYLLDGQRLFDYGISVAKSFKQFNLTPEFVVVGISNKYPNRFSHFSSGSDAFLKFIEEEVIPKVESNYKVSQERLLFGWEYAGGFTVNTLITKPELFEAYLAASPYPLTDKTQAMDSLLSVEGNHNKFLYFAAGVHEGVVTEGALSLKAVLEEKPADFLNWTYQPLQDEEHQSTPFTTLYHGVKKYYEYYPVLQFATLDEFTSFGGVEKVTEYYQKRAEQFGFDAEIPNWTKFSITRCAIRADNYEAFLRLAETLVDKSLIQGLRNNRPYTLSEYYLENKNYEKAIEVYQYLIEKDPNSVKALNKLGDAYEWLGKKKEAKKYYKRAKEAAGN